MQKVIGKMNTCVTFFFLFLLGSLFSDAKRHNVVLFLIDDLGWKDLGCYGSNFYKTPNIDKLASQGVRFTDAYAACALSLIHI